MAEIAYVHMKSWCRTSQTEAPFDHIYETCPGIPQETGSWNEIAANRTIDFSILIQIQRNVCFAIYMPT